MSEIPTLPDALPGTVSVEVRSQVAVVTLLRADKRNAIDTATLLGLERIFRHPPAQVRAVVLAGDGAHFCAGLDLGSLSDASVFEGVEHSRMWHRVMEVIQFGRVPVICALQGAVIGGGLELASAAHLRVADASTFYALPEGQRGIFVGGGGSVRLTRLIGVARMTDLMLTGRVYDAQQGLDAGLCQYLVPAGQALPRALELAERVAATADLTTYAVLQALPRIADASPDQGYLLEALMSAVAQGSDEAKERMQAFLDGRAAKVAVSTEGPQQ